MAPPKSAQKAPPPGQRPISAFFSAKPKTPGSAAKTDAGALAASSGGDASTPRGAGDAPSTGARSPVKDDDVEATREVKRLKTNDDDVMDVDMTIASAPAEVSTPPEREFVMEDVVNKPPSAKKPTKAASKPRGKAKSNALASDDDDDDGGDESGSDFDLGDEDDDGAHAPGATKHDGAQQSDGVHHESAEAQ